MKKYKKKIIVGLTGGPATGKSTAVREFKRCGAHIVDADKIARAILKKGSPALRNVAAAFGRTILLPAGELNRRRMRSIIFKSYDKRKLLEKITHPKIIQVIKSKLRRYSRGVVVLDAPLLFESEIDNLADLAVVVEASRKNQISRLKKRDYINSGQASAMINAQIPITKKIEKADYVIINNKDVSFVKHQVKNLYISLKSRIV
ncbi:MAG: dephospho-CoA kinase [bacterium]